MCFIYIVSLFSRLFTISRQQRTLLECVCMLLLSFDSLFIGLTFRHFSTCLLCVFVRGVSLILFRQQIGGLKMHCNYFIWKMKAVLSYVAPVQRPVTVGDHNLSVLAEDIRPLYARIIELNCIRYKMQESTCQQM